MLAYLGLGSNLGDRVENLQRARRALLDLPAVRAIRESSLVETAPVGLREQPDFVNQVVAVDTTLPPQELLEACLRIEQELGRVRTVKNGPRTIDIDLLTYGDLTLAGETLALPHPRMTERAFVLVPLAELDPELAVAGRPVADWSREADKTGLHRAPRDWHFREPITIDAEDGFRCLGDAEGVAWLDSAEPDGARYSLMMAEPRQRVRANSAEEAAAHLAELTDDFFGVTRPSIFSGWYTLGFLSYEAGSAFDGPPHLPADPAVPAGYWAVYDEALVFHHQTGEAWLTRAAHRTESRLRKTLEQLPCELSQASPAPKVRSNFSRAGYLAAVEKARAYIAAGDIYQVNLAQRFETSAKLDPRALYLRLRRENPAAFAAYVAFPGGAVLSSSPERFLEINGRRIRSAPIKGTRPRGKSPAEDQDRRQELLASEKERAELLMIVDLERNDLGRVCAYGSVSVDAIHRLSTHPSVHHLDAEVSGQLRADVSLAEVFRATFPGGSITGAPKRRAMEIIRELEPCPRGVFCGTIGYVAAGCADFNIAIRSIVWTPLKTDFHVGSGIVWDSQPEQEYEETLAKAEKLFAALGLP